ncbi:hypothetical protein NMY22_g14669 [Coprinellus aureogranulatus]|nr:hypothetical protein NMY22_g14669 [Coprinellus aureogranulatus]
MRRALPCLAAIAIFLGGSGGAMATRGMEALATNFRAGVVEDSEGVLHRCSNATDIEEIWRRIEPSKDLIWHPCYDEPLECARLQVPLDYSDPEGRQAAIALIRKPALIPEDSHLYRGPVLFNPGGPGGSGVNFILGAGRSFSTILGPQFDIVGFDPRGIGRSTPRATFFDSDVERVLVAVSAGPLPVVKNGSVSGIETSWALAQLVGSLAEEHDDGYLKHINTENTATDMLTITRAHGKDKIQYWGFSYGTILGATFASLYPDNIERFIIDGVVDAEDYYSAGWFSNLVDTDKTMSLFFNSCADAGPAKCPFHSSDPEDIRRNLTELYDRVRREPIPVKTNSFYKVYGVVNYSILRGAVFQSLYSPYLAFQRLAHALAELAAGDGTALLAMLGTGIYKCSCDPLAHDMDPVIDGRAAIACNDGDEVPRSLIKLEEYWEKLASVSEWADVWGFIHTNCVGWPKNKKPFRGPFVGNTSFPILVIGNTADPVTPLRSAKKMAEGFKDAVVLTLDAGGHCSLSAPSVCAQRYVQQYFQDGTLPEPDTICQPISKNPFVPITRGVGLSEEAPGYVEAEDADFVNAVLEASDKLEPFFPSPLRRFRL